MRHSRQLMLLAALVLLVAATATYYLCPRGGVFAGKLAIYFVDIGSKGDAILIQTPAGKNIVIDTGYEALRMKRFLEGLEVKTIDLLVNSHPHADHIGGAAPVIRGFDVKEIWDSGLEYSNGHYEMMLSEALKKQEAGLLTFRVVRAGDLKEIEPGLTLRVVHPVDPLPEEANNASVVVLLQYKEFRVLFTGDIEADRIGYDGKTFLPGAEEQILARGEDIRAQVLKLPHHGSRYSTHDAFLAAVNPEVAIALAGKNNEYGHPHGDTLQKLVKAGITPYWTASHGTVVIVSDGLTYEVIPKWGEGK